MDSFREYAEEQLFFNLEEMIKLANKHGVKLNFVSYFHSPANEPLKRYFSKTTIPLVELSPGDIQPYVSEDGFHPSAEGHEFIGKAILQVLEPLLETIYACYQYIKIEAGNISRLVLCLRSHTIVWLLS